MRVRGDRSHITRKLVDAVFVSIHVIGKAKT